jgi:phosphate-selective porin OprO/OprP
MAACRFSAAQQGPALSWLVSPDQVLAEEDYPQTPQAPPSEPPQPSASDNSVEERLDLLEAELAEMKEEPEESPEEYPADPTANFSMELQADAYTFGQDEANIDTVGNIPNGTAFRRARVGWFGEWELTEYRIEFDFAQSGRPTFLDVWAGLKDVPVVDRVRVGHFFEPFSLERMTSNRYGTFLERSLLDSFFVPARNMGIAFSTHSTNERLTASMGVYAYDSDSFGDDVGFERGQALTGRVTALPYWCDGGRHYVHLGAGMSLRNPNENEVRYATQPEARLGAASPNVPFFVDTGTFAAEQDSRGCLEFAWVYGPFSVQSEYMCAAADRSGDPDVFFDGVYVQASLFLTGEHRPYERTAFGGGAFGRVIPYHNACIASRSGPRGCGWGAWEVATRVSHLDGNDEEITGRELTDVTFGMNWHLTPFLRVSSNYIHAFLDDPTVGDSDADILGMRVQYDF